MSDLVPRGRLLWSLLLAAISTGFAAQAAEPGVTEIDPWATMRGCVAVLDRFVACASDPAVRGAKPRWIALADPGKTVEPKEIDARIRGWAKPDERKRQCAVWTRREGAAAHVGEGSALAKLAATAATTCARLAREIGDDGWLPRAIIDGLPARAAAPPPAPARK
jgi:hypothetical protein